MKLITYIALASCLIATFVADGAEYTVTSTNDTGPNSFRAIITLANAVPGPHTISFGTNGHFAAGGTINFLSPLPTISNSVVLRGWAASSDKITLQGSALSFVATSSNVLSSLTIVADINCGQSTTIGSCYIAGSVLSSGILQIAGSSVIGSPSVGVMNSGSCTMNGVTISQCKGRGVLNTGTMTVRGCAIVNNTASAHGAGIFSSGSLEIYDTTISGNSTALSNGGGLYLAGSTKVEACAIFGNTSQMGAGLACDGQVSLNRCAIYQNTAKGQDGSAPIFNPPNGQSGPPGGTGGTGGTAGIFGSGGAGASCSFWTGSTAGGNGGFGCGGGGCASTGPSSGIPPAGIGGLFGGNANPNGTPFTYTNGTVIHYGGTYQVPGGGGGGVGVGGGIFQLSGKVALTNVTISGNVALGGSGGLARWRYATGSWDLYDASGGGGAGLGAGCFVNNGSLYLASCTVANNSASGGGGANSGQGVGGGLFLKAGNATIRNSILAANATTHYGADAYGAVLSGGNNFVGKTTNSTGWDVVTDFQNTTPLSIGPLQNNGGGSLTHALLPDSLCILMGGNDGTPPTDQRGVLRPVNRIDIGAYQYTTLTPTVVIWTNPMAITYPTPLSPVQLNARANVGGGFSYFPPAGYVLNAGSNQMLLSIFTPADPSSYTGASNVVFVDVLKASQMISFPAISPQPAFAAPILLNATASSGLPVTYTLVSGPALLAGNLLSVGATAGQVVIRASQTGNGNYLPAPDAEQSFLVVSGNRPSILSQPSSMAADLGSPAIFSVAATTAPLSYQWQFQSLDLLGETNQFLSIPRVRSSQGGPYRVIVSNPIGSVTSSVAVLTVKMPPGVPNITIPPRDQIIRMGESTTLSIVATGDPPLTYQWYRGQSGDTSGAIAGATGAAYVTSALAGTTNFWVSVRNSLGTVDSGTVTITVVSAVAARMTLSRISGMAVLSVDAPVGNQYWLQFNTNGYSTNWSNLLDWNQSVNPFIYIDAGSIGAKSRFYRAVSH